MMNVIRHLGEGYHAKDAIHFFGSAISRCTLVLLSAFLLSCATSPEYQRAKTPRDIEVDKQFERFREVLSIIQSEYFIPTTLESLLEAGNNGMYQTDEANKLKARDGEYSNNSPIDFEHEYYYLTDNNLKPNKLIDHAISNIADTLGPGSIEFINDEELQELRTASNHLVGIGISLTKLDGNIVIVDTFDKSPAQRLGLSSGDYLLKIDDKPVQNQSLKDVIRWLRGTPGSAVQLTVEHDGKVIAVTAHREIVDASFIESTLYPEGVGYIRISTFFPSIREQFDKHFTDLVSATSSELQGIILDLRNNSGGELRTIIEMAETFLDDGLILSTDGRRINMEMHFLASKKPNDIGSNLKLVVLVNGQTDSGAAMLAAVLQDRKRALIVGTITGSDHSMRTFIPLKTGGALKLKTAKMSLPSRHLFEGGVIPNVCVNNGELDFVDPNDLHGAREAQVSSCLKETIFHENKANDFILQAAFTVLLDKDQRTH